MKTNNSQIQALAKKLFHHKEGVRRIKLMHPYRDWLIGIVAALVVMLLMASWSGYIYFNQRAGISFGESEVEIVSPQYKADLVDQALTVFADRERRMNGQPASQSTPIEVEGESSLVATSTASSTEPTEDIITDSETDSETEQEPEKDPVADSDTAVDPAQEQDQTQGEDQELTQDQPVELAQ